MALSVYLLILFILLMISIGGICADNAAVFAAVPLLVILGIGFVAPWGELKEIPFPATATRMGDEIFVQSKARSFIETNVKYLDNPVVVIEVRKHTVWGYMIPSGPEYRIEISNPEK